MWAQEQGCKVEFGVHEQTLKALIRITRKDGKRAVVDVGVSQDDYLLPTQIGYYDRALGLKSPWFSVDPN